MRAWTFSAALTLQIFAAAVASAATPPAPKNVGALGAEIARGYRDGFQCFVENPATAPENCYIDTAQRNRQQRHAEEPPYELGIFLSACFTYGSNLESDTENAAKDMSSRMALPYDKKALADMYVLFRASQRQVGWTDAQVLGSIPNRDMNDASKKKMRANLKKWTSIPPVAE